MNGVQDKKRADKNRRLTTLALSVAVAMLLSYVESQIPAAPVPGVKLGLANVAVMTVLYILGAKEAALTSAVRVALISLLFGNPVSLVYGITGAAFSLCLMALLKRFSPFSPVGVSVAGGVAHNVGQICAACVVMGTAKIAIYLPVLLVSGIISGVAVGVCAGIVIKKLRF